MKTPEEKAVSINLRRLRALRDVSQREVGNATGVSKRTVAHLEDENSDVNPKLSTIVNIARYFGLHASIMLMSDIDEETLQNPKIGYMLERFAQLSPRHKERIIELIEDLSHIRPEDKA